MSQTQSDMLVEVDEFIHNTEQWQMELKQLRLLLIDCGLTEDFKWKGPCYTFQNSNVAIIGRLKDACILSFFKGALLNDSAEILQQPGKNTQSARVIKFTDVKQITDLLPVLKSYIFEAIEVEKAGLKVAFNDNTKLGWVAELQQKLDADPTFKSAFEKLTPGR